MMFNAAPQTLRRIAGALADAYPLATRERDLALLFGVVDMLCVAGFVPARWRGAACGGVGSDLLIDALIDAATEIDEQGWDVAPGARTLAYYVLKLDGMISDRCELPREWKEVSWS